jgi:hypothetical protein
LVVAVVVQSASNWKLIQMVVNGGSGIVIARYSGTHTKSLRRNCNYIMAGNTIHTFNSSGSFYTGTALATGGSQLYLIQTHISFIHTFTSSGTFTPSQALTADYLVVAGGGGGGGNDWKFTRPLEAEVVVDFVQLLLQQAEAVL